MTVIAWDGQTLAADRRACLGSLYRTTKKIFYHPAGCLLGYSGDADHGEEIYDWFKAGRVLAEFPANLREKDGWGRLLVVWHPQVDVGDQPIWTFERTPHPLRFYQQPFAIGSGRDFALAAMHCGRTAAEAVEVACAFDSSCGDGVDTLDFTLQRS